MNEWNPPDAPMRLSAELPRARVYHDVTILCEIPHAFWSEFMHPLSETEWEGAWNVDTRLIKVLGWKKTAAEGSKEPVS